MSVSGVAERQVRLEPVESIEADARLRHVDQLSDAAYDQIVRLVAAGTESTALPTDLESDLEDGEIVVFTDYYRVEVT